MEHIFVYGTLRPSLYPGRRPPTGVDVFHARFHGKLRMYSLGHYPALVESENDHLITGEVYELPNIKVHDRYEQYLPNGKGLYDRKKIHVKTSLGQEIEAWVYFMSFLKFMEGDMDWATPIPSGDWADKVDTSKIWRGDGY